MMSYALLLDLTANVFISLFNLPADDGIGWY